MGATRRAIRARRLHWAAVTAVLAASTGCASVLGFQEGVPEQDGGPDAATDATTDGTLDARRDATNDGPAVPDSVSPDTAPPLDTGVDVGIDTGCPGVLCNGSCDPSHTDCAGCGGDNDLCPADGTCYGDCSQCAGLAFECAGTCAADCTNCSAGPVECYSCQTGSPPVGSCSGAGAMACSLSCGCNGSNDCPGAFQNCFNFTCYSCGDFGTSQGTRCKNGSLCNASTGTCP